MLKDSEEKSLNTAFDSMERLKEKGLESGGEEADKGNILVWRGYPKAG